MTDFTHIRELLAKATPGEWYNDDVDIWYGAADWYSPDATLLQLSPKDLKLITTLRNNAKAMLDRIDELEAVAAAVSPVLQEADRDTISFNRLRTAIKALEARDE
jgi:hypothetical protein